MTALPPPFTRLKPNPHWAKLPLFNRKNWSRVRFGEVVRMLKEEVDPVADGVDRYVAGEHMQTENVHIRQWGNVGDGYLGPAFIRRFRKGQILYGSRRTYLKKVAVAEWDGVTANTTFVLEAVEGKLLQQLLPWLMLSEQFTKHSIQESKGSTNPYINFPDIAKFEFDLPPLDQQHRIAEILWTVDENLRSVIELESAVSTAKDAFFDDELRNSTERNTETLKRLGDALSRIVAGKSPKSSSNPASNGEFGVLKVSAAGDGVFREEENKALLDPSDFVPSLEVKPGMVLVTRCNALLAGIGRACLVEKTRPGLMLCDKTLHLVPNEELIDRDFLLQGLRRDPYRGFVERSANGTEAKNITQETLRAAPFWIPSLSKQEAIVERLKQFAAALVTAQEQRASLETLRATFTNDIVQ